MLEMPTRRQKIRVMIADDHAILRAGLRMLVDAQADMEVVSEAPDGEQAIQTALQTKPDVALLDITMPRVGGLKALQEMARDCRETRVLVLTMHDDPAYLRSALAAGASGYLLKRAVDSELIAAIRAVHRGGIFVDPRLASILVQDVLEKKSEKARSARPVNILSKRELQVLRLVARGYTSAAIAKQIFVGVKTIETYRSRIAEKLGLRTRSDVVRFAVQAGLLTAESIEILSQAPNLPDIWRGCATCQGFSGQSPSLFVTSPIAGLFHLQNTTCRLQKCIVTVHCRRLMAMDALLRSLK
jgi:two-component system response regulator NreC